MRRLALAALLVLAACGGDDDSAPPTEAEPAGTDATDPAPTEPSATEPPATEPPATDPAPTEPPATEPPATEASEPELAGFEPIGPGSYEVGVETLTLVDGDRGRELTMDVWFPLEPGTGGEPHAYTLIPGAFYTSPVAVSASRGNVADGEFPLVVYSHGAAGLRYIHSNLSEALAAHGYIVAAVDHAGDTALDQIVGTRVEGAEMAVTRPADVGAVIDAMTTPGRDDTGGWPQHVDDGSVAVAGHSFGGFTALALDAGYENEAGSVEVDDRVDALVLMAPAVGGRRSLLSDDDLARVDEPVLVMVGTGDTSTPADPNVDRVWANVSSPAVYRADLVEGRHQTFTDACAYERDVLSLPDVPAPVVEAIESRSGDTCSDDAMPAARAQELTNTLAVTFLDSVFGDAEMITAENTEIPDDLLYESR